jgi:hypothetical protein
MNGTNIMEQTLHVLIAQTHSGPIRSNLFLYNSTKAAMAILSTKEGIVMTKYDVLRDRRFVRLVCYCIRIQKTILSQLALIRHHPL